MGIFLGFYCREGAGMSILYLLGLKLLLFELSAENKGEITWAFLSTCPVVGQKGKEEELSSQQ